MNQKGITNILGLGIVLAIVILGFSLGYVYLKPEEKTNSNVNIKINTNTTTNTNSASLVPVDTVAEAHTNFGLNILKELYNSDKTENIFISPTSIALALSMVYNGSDGETKTEIAEALEVSGISLEELNQQSQSLITQYSNIDPKVEIAIANSIWTREGFNPKSSFINLLENWYLAQVKALDFDKEEAVDEINEWVKNNTQEKIESIVDYPISSDVIMYLINATYFKGTWTNEFDPEDNKERIFTNGDSSQEDHIMMYRHDNFSYLENDDFQAISLTYGENERLSMYVFLPKGELELFMAKLNSENWNNWLTNFQSEKGTIYLPKLKLEYEKSLNEYLKALGMNSAFKESADFSEIAPNIFISDVKHKTFVDVNEEGTEAAAVTSVETELTSVGNPEETFYMEVNKPYFFVIRDNDNGENLFTGIINNPEI